MNYQTWQDVSEAAGVPARRLRKLRVRPDWPAPRSLPLTPEHVAAIRRWRAAFRTTTAASDADDDVARAHKQVQLLLTRERMLHEKLRREITAGRYISRELVDGSIGGLAKLFIDGLGELAKRLPEVLGGRTGPEIEKELQRSFDGLRRRIAGIGEYALCPVSELMPSLAPQVVQS